MADIAHIRLLERWVAERPSLSPPPADLTPHALKDAVDTALAELTRLRAEVARLTQERDGWQRTAIEMANNADVYRGIVHQVGAHFGVAAYTSDDGSVQDEVLALKVPELAEQAVAERDALRARVTWQPISSAPKNIPLLLWDANRQVAVSGQWWVEPTLDSPNGYEPGWAGWSCDDDLIIWDDHDPTHWMPLPAPPDQPREDEP